MTDVLINLAGRFFVGLTLVLIPLLGLYISRLIWRVPSLSFFARIPVLTQLSSVLGIMIGLGVFITAPWRPGYGINTIVKTEGPWDMPWREYLNTLADPALYEYAPLWAQLTADDIPTRWMVFGVALAAIAFSALMATLLLLRGVELVIGLLGIVFVALVGQALTIYLVTLLPYALNTLNFWMVLLALIVLQYYRYAGKNGGH